MHLRAKYYLEALIFGKYEKNHTFPVVLSIVLPYYTSIATFVSFQEHSIHH